MKQVCLFQTKVVLTERKLNEWYLQLCVSGPYVQLPPVMLILGTSYPPRDIGLQWKQMFLNDSLFPKYLIICQVNQYLLIVLYVVFSLPEF
jgi:hypothetical protein